MTLKLVGPLVAMAFLAAGWVATPFSVGNAQASTLTAAKADTIFAKKKKKKKKKVVVSEPDFDGGM